MRYPRKIPRRAARSLTPRYFVLLIAWLALGCDRPPARLVPDLGAGDLAAASCDESRSCPPGTRCYQSTCIADNGTCAAEGDCQNDSYCDCSGGDRDAGSCACLPYGVGPRGLSNPACQGHGFSAFEFQPPLVKCQWNGGGVVDTPLVIDLDRDGRPEIVFAAFNAHPAEAYPVAIRGNDCSLVWSAPSLKPFGRLAAADLDLDGFPEIVGLSTDTSKVVVIDHGGAPLASAAVTPYGTYSSPSIADVDGVAPPEIVIEGSVLRYVKGSAQLQVLFSRPAAPGVSSFADMDGDGRPEVVTTKEVLDGVTGADKTPGGYTLLSKGNGYVAIADFNADGRPDIVRTVGLPGASEVLVFDYAGDHVLAGPFTKASTGIWGLIGPPTVGDYDGDGKPDIGVASRDSYFVYSLRCDQQPKPADCAETGLLWARPVKDASSAQTGSSTFDFNGDGIAEVIYRDECWLRVYHGPDGRTLFARQVSSATTMEGPVIADTDNDGHADIVVPSDASFGASYCEGTAEGQTGQVFSGGATQGILVFTDPLNRWMPSRPIWNEHAYHITNINDDLTVPTTEPPSWLGSNSYRKNVQGSGGANSFGLPDLTGGKPVGVDFGSSGECEISKRLWAQICNRGAVAIPAAVPGTFYATDPRLAGALALCTTHTTAALQPGECEAVWCDWPTPTLGTANIWFRADDDGVNVSQFTECEAGNNLLFLPGAGCGIPG